MIPIRFTQNRKKPKALPETVAVLARPDRASTASQLREGGPLPRPERHEFILWEVRAVQKGGCWPRPTPPPGRSEPHGGTSKHMPKVFFEPDLIEVKNLPNSRDYFDTCT